MDLDKATDEMHNLQKEERDEEESAPRDNARRKVGMAPLLIHAAMAEAASQVVPSVNGRVYVKPPKDAKTKKRRTKNKAARKTKQRNRKKK
jgi:hypothetical protein